MYIWRVWKDNRFAGYVNSPTQFEAYLRATKEFGENVWVEKTVMYQVIFPNNQDHFVGDSQQN